MHQYGWGETHGERQPTLLLAVGSRFLGTNSFCVHSTAVKHDNSQHPRILSRNQATGESSRLRKYPRSDSPANVSQSALLSEGGRKVLSILLYLGRCLCSRLAPLLPRPALITLNNPPSASRYDAHRPTFPPRTQRKFRARRKFRCRNTALPRLNFLRARNHPFNPAGAMQYTHPALPRLPPPDAHERGSDYAVRCREAMQAMPEQEVPAPKAAPAKLPNSGCGETSPQLQGPGAC